MTPDLVSVIVPVYNGKDRLGAALESIFTQAYRPIEVFVVDDGSTDASADIARSFPDFIYVYQPNSGVAAARNTALRRARGEFIAFLDQDDRWTPDKLDVQLKHMREHPDIDILFANKHSVIEGEIPAWLPHQHVGGAVPGMLPGTMLTRARVFSVAGCFDSSLINGSDSEWLARTRDCGLKTVTLPDMLLWRHVHDQNESRNIHLGRKEMFGMLRGSIERKRARGGQSP